MLCLQLPPALWFLHPASRWQKMAATCAGEEQNVNDIYHAGARCSYSYKCIIWCSYLQHTEQNMQCTFCLLLFSWLTFFCSSFQLNRTAFAQKKIYNVLYTFCHWRSIKKRKTHIPLDFFRKLRLSRKMRRNKRLVRIFDPSFKNSFRFHG